MILVLTALRARISDSKAGKVGLASFVIDILINACDGCAANLAAGIMSSKNNASTIYRNICPHKTITTLAVELLANGERAHVKKYLNR